MLRNRQFSGGLAMFFFQFLAQAGLFFVVPLYLSVCLGLSAIDTGVRLLPLSATLLVAALGIPRLAPNVSPRLVVRGGLLGLFAGTVVLLAALDADAGPEIVLVPMLLIGLGIGALASQLGAVTVSAVPDEQSTEVGGIQNTATNLGASLGTAISGSLLIAAVTTSFLANIQQSPAIPQQVKSQAQVELAGGVPFVSDADLKAALDESGASSEESQAALDAYADARIDGLRSALAILALLHVERALRSHRGSRGRSPVRRCRVAMCRWLAYSGSPIRLEELLVKRDRSLIDQSLHSRLGATTTNGDGFGVGWYDEDGRRGVYRSTHPAWNDRNLRELAAGISLAALLRAHPRVDRHRDPGDEHAPVPLRELALDAQRADPRLPCRARASSWRRSTTRSSPRSRARPTRRRCSTSRSRSGSRTIRAAVERMVGFVEETGREHGSSTRSR